MKLPETSSHQRYAILDGVRGVAILLVLFSHLDTSGLGQFGVWLFFVLSSFLLSLYFFEKPDRIFSLREWLNYAVRRVLRIYPLLILATVGAVLAGWWGWGAVMPVLLLQDPAWWAIFVEFRFYFLLPFVVLAFYAAGRTHAAGPWALLAVAFVAHQLIFPVSITAPGWDYPKTETARNIIAFEYTIVFVTGCFAAWFFANYEDRLNRWRSSRFLDAVLAIGMLAPCLLGGKTMSFLSGQQVEYDWYHRYWVPFGAYFAVLIIGLMVSDGYTKRVIASPFFVFCGVVSYGVYMGMDFVIHPIKEAKIGQTLVYFFAIPIFFLAWCSYRLIERPLSKIRMIPRM